MLDKETKEKLEGFGFDVSKLTEAIQSDSDVKLEVPNLKKEDEIKDWLSPEQKQEYGNNRFQEGKTAMSEIKAKELKEKFNIDVEGKDLDKVIETYVELKEKNAASGDWVNEKKTLQQKIQELSESKTTLETDYSNKLFNIEVRNKVYSEMPSDAVLSKDDLTTLFLSKYTPKNEDGSTIFFHGDKKLKDNVENPLQVSQIVNQFIDEGKYRKVDGMGGGDEGGGGSDKKFKNTQEYMSYCEANGIEPNSKEGQSLLRTNKAEDFEYN